MSRDFLIVANWKMNGDSALAKKWPGEVAAVARAEKLENVRAAVCPAFVHLQIMSEGLGDSGIFLGAQNIAAWEKAPRTGEVSAAMLVEFGCRFVIVGHSERRDFMKESHSRIAKKVRLAEACKMTPILCVGESSSDRKNNQTEAVLAKQLEFALGGENPPKSPVIAYEPVWAIGAGEPAAVSDIAAAHQFISSHSAVGKKIRVIYGGSVTAENAREIFSAPEVGGALVGGASLDAAEFAAICAHASAAAKE